MDSASAALQLRSSWMFALIVRLSVLEFHWSQLWHATILVLIIRHVYVNIHAWWRCSLRGGLKIPPQRSSNRRLTLPGVICGWMGKHLHYLRYSERAVGVAPRRHIRTK